VWSDLPVDIEKIIIDKAKKFGASLAGFVDASAVRNSPSHRVSGGYPLDDEVKSILVLAFEVDPSEPSLDWWDGKPGRAEANRRVRGIGKELKKWLKKEYDIKSDVIPYSIKRGGINFKDTAVLAGLGILGKNNLLITPEFGPRVRLGALSIDLKVESPEKLDFNPCENCTMPCRDACPQEAFVEDGYSEIRCRIQMDLDEENASLNLRSLIVIKYCRECEISCPVGASKSL
jgi:epoxyqueuosine reductase